MSTSLNLVITQKLSIKKVSKSRDITKVKLSKTKKNIEAIKMRKPLSVEDGLLVSAC